MGKKKIDKLKQIESTTQRNVAFCKRKRGFLKKAIELSSLCGQKIFIVIYDEEKGRVVQFQTEDSFGIGATYKAIKIARGPDNSNNFEKFNNTDYHRLSSTDFRSLRYKKKQEYADGSVELISELEGESCAEDDFINLNGKKDEEASVSQEELKYKQNQKEQNRQNDGNQDFIGQIEEMPSLKRQKIKKDQKVQLAIEIPQKGSKKKQVDQVDTIQTSNTFQETKEQKQEDIFIPDQAQSHMVIMNLKNKKDEDDKKGQDVKGLTSTISLMDQQLSQAQNQQVQVQQSEQLNKKLRLSLNEGERNQVTQALPQSMPMPVPKAQEIHTLQDVNSQTKQTNNIFDPDLIKSLGVINLKRQEKRKRKLGNHKQSQHLQVPQTIGAQNIDKSSPSPSKAITDLPLNLQIVLQQQIHQQKEKNIIEQQQIQLLIQQYLKEQQSLSGNHLSPTQQNALNKKPQGQSQQQNQLDQKQQLLKFKSNFSHSSQRSSPDVALNKMLVQIKQNPMGGKNVPLQLQGSLQQVPMNINNASFQQPQIQVTAGTKVEQLPPHHKQQLQQIQGQIHHNPQQPLQHPSLPITNATLLQQPQHHTFANTAAVASGVTSQHQHQQQQLIDPSQLALLKPPISSSALHTTLNDIENNLNQTLANLCHALERGRHQENGNGGVAAIHPGDKQKQHEVVGPLNSNTVGAHFFGMQQQAQQDGQQQQRGFSPAADLASLPSKTTTKGTPQTLIGGVNSGITQSLQALAQNNSLQQQKQNEQQLDLMKQLQLQQDQVYQKNPIALEQHITHIMKNFGSGNPQKSVIETGERLFHQHHHQQLASNNNGPPVIISGSTPMFQSQDATQQLKAGYGGGALGNSRGSIVLNANHHQPIQYATAVPLQNQQQYQILGKVQQGQPPQQQQTHHSYSQQAQHAHQPFIQATAVQNPSYNHQALSLQMNNHFDDQQSMGGGQRTSSNFNISPLLIGGGSQQQQQIYNHQQQQRDLIQSVKMQPAMRR